MRKFEAEWSGSYPNLCSGEWKLTCDGEDITNLIPKEIRNEPMGTYGKYSYWFLDDYMSEQWDEYTDGLSCDDWIDKHSVWLENITQDKAELESIYEAFNASDFRRGSCGGCI